MKITIHHVHHVDPALGRWLDCVRKTLELNQEKIMATLAELRAEVAAEKTIEDSTHALIVGLIKQVEDNKSDPAALDQIIADMKANIKPLADDVVAGTTQAPTV